MWRDIALRLRALFFRWRMDEELQEELQFHIDMQALKNRRGEFNAAEAKRQARLQFGSVVRATEECREQRGISFIEILINDLRFSLRMLRKSPGFTAVAAVTLAMAIGANAVVFGVMDVLILRPVNVPDPESLYETEYGVDTGFQSYPNYLDLRDRNRSFDGLAAFSFAFVGLDTGDNPSSATGYATSGNYFDVLRIHPYLGRFFHSSDEHGRNSAPYLVLSYAYWHSHFQDDRGVLGHVVRLSKHPFTIIGVAPPDFRGTVQIVSPDFFMPIVNMEQVSGENLLDARGNTHAVFETFGHLKPGVTPAQAAADFQGVGAYLEKTYPKEFAQKSFSLAHAGLSSFGRAVRAFVAGLMLLAGLILLAACANLGSLFAARAADRSREVALRLALGASRIRILRQLFTEAVLISLIGGAVGLLGSVVLLSWLSAWHPFPKYPINVPVTAGPNVYGVALLLALGSGFLFGAVPVRQVLRTDPYQIVKAGSTSRVGRRMAVRDLLLIAQIAICAVLVTSSLVAVRGLARSLHSNFGFEPSNAMLVDTDLNMAGYSRDVAPAMQKRMIDAMETIPGVTSVGLIDVPPLGGDYNSTTVFTDETADL